MHMLARAYFRHKKTAGDNSTNRFFINKIPRRARRRTHNPKDERQTRANANLLSSLRYTTYQCLLFASTHFLNLSAKM